MSVTSPVEMVIDDDALWRTKNPIGGRLEVPGQGFGVRVDQSSVGIKSQTTSRIMRASSLEMIELPRLKTGNKDAPNVSPAILVRIEVENFRGLGIINVIVKQQSHLGGTAAEDDKLHSGIADDGSVGQHMSKLKFGLSVSHMH